MESANVGDGGRGKTRFCPPGRRPELPNEPLPQVGLVYFFLCFFIGKGLFVLARSIYFRNEFNSTVFHGCTATRSNEMHKLVALTVCPEQIILPTSL